MDLEHGSEKSGAAQHDAMHVHAGVVATGNALCGELIRAATQSAGAAPDAAVGGCGASVGDPEEVLRVAEGSNGMHVNANAASGTAVCVSQAAMGGG